MKKVIYRQFGNSDVLEIEETEIPAITQNQVLIQVKSVSINPIDWKLFSGSMKMLSGKKFPKMVAIDFSGVITKTAKNIVNFKVGDEVFGAVQNPMKEGVLAEYIAINAEQITLKPKNISFAQAAAMTSVGTPAIKAFEEKLAIEKGQKVLINGASGGVGMIAIQIAKAHDAIVTAVSNTKAMAYTKDWGADFVIDYREEEITQLDSEFDVIFELSGSLTFSQAKGIMATDATFITLMGAGTMKDILIAKLGALLSKRKFHAINAPTTSEIRLKLVNYAKNGMTIHIEHSFSLDEVGAAYSTIEKNGIIGKAVILIG